MPARWNTARPRCTASSGNKSPAGAGHTRRDSVGGLRPHAGIRLRAPCGPSRPGQDPGATFRERGPGQEALDMRLQTRPGTRCPGHDARDAVLAQAALACPAGALPRRAFTPVRHSRPERPQGTAAPTPDSASSTTAVRNSRQPRAKRLAERQSREGRGTTPTRVRAWRADTPGPASARERTRHAPEAHRLPVRARPPLDNVRF